MLRITPSNRYSCVMHRTFSLSQYFLIAFFILAATFAGDVFAAQGSYFEMGETRSENLKPFPKWTGVMSRYDDQKKIPDDQCDKVRFHPCDAIGAWNKMLDSVRGKSLREQMRVVNEWANAHPYVIDQINWGMDDFWDTPYEFMTLNGDCEDYAIAKYYSLRALGVPEDKLRIMIVQDFNLGGIIHAILGVYSDGELMILDNQAEQVRPALKIYHYRPIYGVNENWWWLYAPRNG